MHGPSAKTVDVALNIALPLLAATVTLVVAMRIWPLDEVPHRESLAAATFAESAPAPAAAHAPVSAAMPVVGETRYHTVARGESLLGIARHADTDVPTLMRVNGLTTGRVRRGERLLVPTRYVLPMVVDNGIVVNIPERGIYLFRNGRLLARYPVAVGKRTWETPTGRFRIVRKVLNPTWVPPAAMVTRERVPVRPIPPGPSNPIGDRWMGWSAPEVGFHSTWSVATIGKAASHACVRMYPEAAHRMFENVYLGMPIYALYEPIKVGRGPDGYYVSVSPDVYHRGAVSTSRAMALLARAGIRSSLDAAMLARIVRRQDGYPHLVARYASPGMRLTQRPSGGPGM